MRGLPSFHVPTADTKFLFSITIILTTIYFMLILVFSVVKAGCYLNSGHNSSAYCSVTWAMYLNFQCLCCLIGFKMVDINRTYSCGFIYYFPLYFLAHILPNILSAFQDARVLCNILYKNYDYTLSNGSSTAKVTSDSTWTDYEER